MRLADEILAARGTDAQYGGLITNIGVDIVRAERFELNDDVVLACQNLIGSRPSSLLAALPLCRLSYPKMWVEWRGGARTDRDNDDTRPNPRKFGCLLERKDGDVQRCTGTWAWVHELSGKNSITVCPLGATFDWRQTSGIDTDLQQAISLLSDPTTPADLKSMLPRLKSVLAQRTRPKHSELAAEMKNIGRWQAHASSPVEVAAVAELQRHSEMVLSHHAFQFAAMISERAPESASQKMFQSWLQDLIGEPIFVQAIVAMLNSKNCVAHEKENLTQLNKVRLKRGKKPLMDFVTTKLVLSRSQERTVSAIGIDRRTARQHLVRGHFKVRRTGIYWWSPFLRGDSSSTVPRQEYRVVA